MSPEIPDHWIDRLFAKMGTMYGAAFAAMWRDIDLAEIKATWKHGLGEAHVTDEGLRRGVAALFYTRRPPNLPEFIELCARPAMHRQNPLTLTNEANRTQPAEARVQLTKVREAAKSILSDQNDRDHGIAWAQRLIDRAARGEQVTSHQLTCAKAAIEQWQTTHGTMRHNREPGSDDE
ncbi:hypothetical protein SB861_03290 [Paraburkholderia sp. SIMBA_049]